MTLLNGYKLHSANLSFFISVFRIDHVLIRMLKKLWLHWFWRPSFVIGPWGLWTPTSQSTVEDSGPFRAHWWPRPERRASWPWSCELTGQAKAPLVSWPFGLRRASGSRRASTASSTVWRTQSQSGCLGRLLLCGGRCFFRRQPGGPTCQMRSCWVRSVGWNPPGEAPRIASGSCCELMQWANSRACLKN